MMIVVLCSYAQDFERIKADPAYVWGEGWGNSIEEADRNALANLTSKISAKVTSTTTNKEQSTVTNGNLNEVTDFQSHTSVNSHAILTNTEVLVLDHDKPHVARWVKRTEIQRNFELRKLKINEYIRLADEAEAMGKVDDALRYYYWAYILTQSLQYPSEMKHGDNILTAWLPDRIREVINNVKAEVTSVDGEDVDLSFTYKGKPVNSLDFTYYHGIGWSNICSVKDGVGSMQVSGNTSSYMLKYEYKYEGQAGLDAEVKAVMETTTLPTIQGAQINLTRGAQTMAATPVVAPVQVTSESQMLNTESFSENTAQERSLPALMGNDEAYQSIINQIAAAIRQKTTAGISQYFTPEAFDIYQRLIHNGNARIVGTPQYSLTQDDDKVYCRGLKMSFSYRTAARKNFTEEVVFTFDSDRRICNIAYGLGQTAEDDILNKGVWSPRTRQVLMNFLENYKTAYALKRLDYLRDLFAEDALIIVGSTTKKTEYVPLSSVQSGNYGYGSGGNGGGSYGSGGARGGASRSGSGGATARVGERTGKWQTATYTPRYTPEMTKKITETVRYTKYDRDSYIKNLSRNFARNEYVNIRFMNNDVRKVGGKGEEVYGIRITQDYYSSTYSDHGYLFLQVDVNDPDNPVIYIRTWQPTPDPDKGLIDAGWFR